MYEYIQYLQDISPSQSDKDDSHSDSSKSDGDFIPIGADETDTIGFQKEGNFPIDYPLSSSAVVLQVIHLHLPVRGHLVIEEEVVQDGMGRNLKCSCIHVYKPKWQDLHRLVERELQMVLCGVASHQKDATRPADRPLGENVVLRLMEPFFDKGRTETTDNYFTSVSLANKLKKRKTSLVGTLNRARWEIPSSVKHTPDPLHTNILLKSNDIVLTSYQGKGTKNMLVLSTLHTGVDIDQQTEKQIPEMIKFYNGTKYGTDIVDQMGKNNTRAMSHRWPVHVVYNILDLASINAHTLYTDVTK
ncbi:hypothetical protein PR048_011821 [Dryococelus australis]|uniref:PiggyBac transposable element-derived protein domain-containing protein n=1 Tax=Dryococelus australis TaxID=614101 RepID=A0ABQ9HNY7_9NEOP|nr:hypothetical protein PR048_011821 [Dryococelus australis]